MTALNICVLTVSSTRTSATDKSGDTLEHRIVSAGHALHTRAIVSDKLDAIQSQVKEWCSDSQIDVVITTGGTGLTGSDVTPDAVTPLFDKTIDGFSVMFHQISMQTIGISTVLSRATAGISEGTYIFCLPGSTGAVKDGWDNILVHLLNVNHKPCNFVEVMPRLLEPKL